MSILSDKSFIRRSTLPTHVARYDSSSNLRFVHVGITDSAEEIDKLMAAGYAFPFNVEDADRYWKSLGQTGPMFEPFERTSVRRNGDQKIASYGVSSYGYDIRAAAEFKVFRGFGKEGRIDYKDITDDMFDTVKQEDIWIPPNGFILARSVEYVRVPRDYLALCIGKSTIARAGINCLCTPLEPEWEGHITLEFSNTTNLPNRFRANEGVLQLVFVKGDQTCETSYNDRDGKYNHQQAEIVLPRV